MTQYLVLLVLFIIAPLRISGSFNVPGTGQLKRQQRSFDHISPQEHFELWTQSTFDILFPPQRQYFQPYVSPDKHFGNSIETNSLETYDPLLITGPEAKLIANYLYSKELFFDHIPHEKLLCANQKLRREQGLSENYIRPNRRISPFQRRYR